MKIARCALFGKTSINSAAPVGRADSMYLPPELIIESTVGLLAWCATMASVFFSDFPCPNHVRQANYILSWDTQFTHSGIGGRTGINYLRHFDYYKRWLYEAITKMQAQPNQIRHIDRLFSYWDATLFSAHNKAGGRNASQADAEVINIDLDEPGSIIAKDMEALARADTADPEVVPNIPTRPATPINPNDADISNKTIMQIDVNTLSSQSAEISTGKA